MYLYRGLDQQEHPTKNEDEVAPRNLQCKYSEQRRRQRHDPGNTGEQPETHEQR
jgi:hypothetical protein